MKNDTNVTREPSPCHIDPDGIYYVVTDSYSANYSYNNMTVVEIYADDIFARDLVAEFFEK